MSTALLTPVRRARLAWNKRPEETVTWEGTSLRSFLMARNVTLNAGETVAIDGDVVHKENFEGTEVPEDARVSVVPQFAGG